MSSFAVDDGGTIDEALVIDTSCCCFLVIDMEDRNVRLCVVNLVVRDIPKNGDCINHQQKNITGLWEWDSGQKLEFDKAPATELARLHVESPSATKAEATLYRNPKYDGG
ncbi:hypothetical protein NC653_020195 [Populus alba x Populus x berolinensis]|uniref:Uncharacterized protein n=2 Tax=Populus TaxID=3689 RepID=A0A4U5R297_POPAL|nr:hypothetical protein NC653_020195 [Populus alba x Populus x berolinensis]TKS17800.1 hypothetical protein D5086_0000011710 [Populus alba]